MVAFCFVVAYSAGAMKKLFVLFALVGLGLSSCERHTWETKKEDGGRKSSDTINLFPTHGAEHAEEGGKSFWADPWAG